MGKPTRRSRRKAVLYDPTVLAEALPVNLRNPNGVGSGVTIPEHQRAVADYLRTVGARDVPTELAAAVSAATGVATAITYRDRLVLRAGPETGEPQHHAQT